jgi:hypothetical protein
MKIVTLLLLLVSISQNAESKEQQTSPYGASFGEEFNATKHEIIRRRGNVRSVKLKTADRPDDTEELRAEICDEYGLQVITWRSHTRSSSAATLRHAEITKNFTEKYGKPQLKRGSSFWHSKEFHVVAKVRSKGKDFQNQIRYFGIKNEPCFESLMIHLQTPK